MNMQMIPETQIKRYMLEKINVSTRTTLTPYMLNSAMVSSWQDYAAENLTIQLDAYFASKKHEETSKSTRVVKSIDAPATWWDHWKQFAAPEWFKKRYPPKFITIETKLEEIVTTTTTKICPHLPIDPQQDHIEFLVMDTMPAMKSRRIPKT